jgi:hypothetical protein
MSVHRFVYILLYCGNAYTPYLSSFSFLNAKHFVTTVIILDFHLTLSSSLYLRMGAQGSTKKKPFLIKVLKTGVVRRKISDH